MSPVDEPRLYRELAPWFHLLTSPVDYEEEAELYGRLLVEHAEGPVETVLELGSGGGNNASHLKRHFTLTLVDRSPEMLELSRGLNPELEHVEGDMRTVRLDRTFDAVFVHDALAYILTEPDLQAVFDDRSRPLPAGRERGLRPRLRPGDIRPAHEPWRPRLEGRRARAALRRVGPARSLRPDEARRRLRVPDPRGRDRPRRAGPPRLRALPEGNLAPRPRGRRVRGRRRRAGLRRRAGGPARLRLSAPEPEPGYDSGREALPRHDVRVPDERSRLGAHQGHARGAGTGGGRLAGRGRRARLQHVHDPREARPALRRAPGEREDAEARRSRRR